MKQEARIKKLKGLAKKMRYAKNKQTIEALMTPIKVLWNAKKQFLGEDLTEGTHAKQP